MGRSTRQHDALNAVVGAQHSNLGSIARVAGQLLELLRQGGEEPLTGKPLLLSIHELCQGDDHVPSAAALAGAQQQGEEIESFLHEEPDERVRPGVRIPPADHRGREERQRGVGQVSGFETVDTEVPPDHRSQRVACEQRVQLLGFRRRPLEQQSFARLLGDPALDHDPGEHDLLEEPLVVARLGILVRLVEHHQRVERGLILPGEHQRIGEQSLIARLVPQVGQLLVCLDGRGPHRIRRSRIARRSAGNLLDLLCDEESAPARSRL